MKIKIKYFSETERDTLYSVMQTRRDMRHFIPETKVEENVLQRILEAAHSAPSVGLMQPWRFIRIIKEKLREEIAQLVDDERKETALKLDARKKEFLELKVEGVRECAELIAVVNAPDDGTVFGRRSMPDEMALCSTACAIQNLWLAARAENIGMGWVSLFEPKALANALQCPEGAKPVALLCIGPVESFYSRPMLEAVGWRNARPLDDLLSEDSYFFQN
ncbi:MAG TPA: 5,6-dimethylbenzimidazole synthase [Gammaproteobacteria bacterium]|nr:5,6-dimethylbenzimidazole synthase [Gammaproteobacteria bacterium]